MKGRFVTASIFGIATLCCSTQAFAIDALTSGDPNPGAVDNAVTPTDAATVSPTDGSVANVTDNTPTAEATPIDFAPALPSPQATPDSALSDAADADYEDYTGSTDPNSLVTLFVDGFEYDTTLADSDGDWAFSLPPEFFDGIHTLTTESAPSAEALFTEANSGDSTASNNAPATPITVNDQNDQLFSCYVGVVKQFWNQRLAHIDLSFGGPRGGGTKILIPFPNKKGFAVAYYQNNVVQFAYWDYQQSVDYSATYFLKMNLKPYQVGANSPYLPEWYQRDIKVDPKTGATAAAKSDLPNDIPTYLLLAADTQTHSALAAAHLETQLVTLLKTIPDPAPMGWEGPNAPFLSTLTNSCSGTALPAAVKDAVKQYTTKAQTWRDTTKAVNPAIATPVVPALGAPANTITYYYAQDCANWDPLIEDSFVISDCYAYCIKNGLTFDSYFAMFVCSTKLPNSAPEPGGDSFFLFNFNEGTFQGRCQVGLENRLSDWCSSWYSF